MRSLVVFVRTLGTNLVKRIAIDLRFGFSKLKSRNWHKIRHLIPTFRGTLVRLDKTPARTLGERLGYGRDARLLIVHADDLGLAHSVNTAFIAGLATRLINSGSAMVPCPAFTEIAAFAQSHPEADIGIHLTLTSGTENDKWAPAASQAQVSSLVDRQGCLLQRWTAETRISLVEVEIELRAQIEKAYAAGLHPTHLDSHQYLLLGGQDVFEVYLRLGREYKLPVLVAREWFSRLPYLQFSLTPRDVVLDRTVIMQGNVRPEQWPLFYRRAIEQLQPGVTEILIHPGYDNHELRCLIGEGSDWGAAWRQRDFDFFTSDEFQGLLNKHSVKLTNWREIANRML